MNDQGFTVSDIWRCNNRLCYVTFRGSYKIGVANFEIDKGVLKLKLNGKRVKGVRGIKVYNG